MAPAYHPDRRPIVPAVAYAREFKETEESLARQREPFTAEQQITESQFRVALAHILAPVSLAVTATSPSFAAPAMTPVAVSHAIDDDLRFRFQGTPPRVEGGDRQPVLFGTPSVALHFAATRPTTGTFGVFTAPPTDEDMCD